MTTIAIVVGSLRRDSFNRKFAEALTRLAPPTIEFTWPDIGSLPLYDQDDDSSPPAAAVALKAAIRAADGVIFVTPEYNRSIPGDLNNAIDWPSRPFGHSVWEGKPAAIVGATAGQSGTAQAQAHLRSILPVLGVTLMGRPEVYQTLKPGMIDADHLITDERTRDFLRNWVDAYVAWIGKFATPQPLRIAAE
jgi:chromate reductase